MGGGDCVCTDISLFNISVYVGSSSSMILKGKSTQRIRNEDVSEGTEKYY